MITEQPGKDAREFPFSDQDFEKIAAVAKTEFGLSLAASKKPLVYSRLAKRLRTRKIGSFQAYLDLLKRPDEADEKTELLSALTTNVTQFFREDHHFNLLRETLMPRFAERARAGQRVRIWSAGCSSGQEPYSMAMTILDMMPDAQKYDIKILATDIDPAILKRAQAASYPVQELTGIAKRLHKFLDLGAAPDAPFAISDQVRALVSFGPLNLIADWPMRGSFDLIFCRNVTIYFDAETQKRLWSRFTDSLAPGGHLCIGHSERVSGPATAQYRNVGVTSYEKMPAAKTH